MLMLDRTVGKGPRRRHQNQRLTHLLTQKLETNIYTQRIRCRPMKTLYMLPNYFGVCMNFAYIYLEGLVFLMFFIPSRSCTLSDFSSLGFPPSEVFQTQKDKYSIYLLICQYCQCIQCSPNYNP